MPWVQISDVLQVAVDYISSLASKKVEISLSFCFAFLCSRVLRYYNGLKIVNNSPGLRVAFQPISMTSFILPKSSWNPGLAFAWYGRNKLYKQCGTDTISIVPYIAGSPTFCTSNVEVIRQVASNGSFIKPYLTTKAILLWGMNLLAADGETWRRHRRITGPAFNNKLYGRVFDESIALYHNMVTAEKWGDLNEVLIPVSHSLTYKFALLTIGKCGFGIPFNWSAPDEAEDRSMSAQEAIGLLAENMLVGVLPWLMLLPFGKFRRLRMAHRELAKFMNEKVTQRKAMVQSSRADGLELETDIFTMLVQANEDEAAKHKLNNQELIGNVYIMLTAGHETTASSLATTIGLLALHTDIQNELFEQIEAVVGCGRDPTFDDYPKLNKVLAVFLEATRMFTPGYVFLRQATEDTVLKVQNPIGQEGFTGTPIKKGTIVIADMIGLQYNPRYYDKPEKFKPSRWYGMENEWEKLTAFSVGQRACIGRKFATTEAVAFLTMLLRDWQLEPLLRAGENKDDWSKHVFDIKTLEFSLRIQDVPVKLIKRQLH